MLSYFYLKLNIVYIKSKQKGHFVLSFSSLRMALRSHIFESIDVQLEAQ